MLTYFLNTNHIFNSEVVYQKSVLKKFTKFTGKHLCQSPRKLQAYKLRIKQEIPTQVFSYKFCKVKKTFLRTPKNGLL